MKQKVAEKKNCTMIFFRAKMTVRYFGPQNMVVLLALLNMLTKKFNSCIIDTYAS